MTKKLTLMVPDELINTIESNKEKLGNLVDILKQSIEEQIAISDRIQKTLEKAGSVLSATNQNNE